LELEGERARRQGCTVASFMGKEKNSGIDCRMSLKVDILHSCKKIEGEQEKRSSRQPQTISQGGGDQKTGILGLGKKIRGPILWSKFSSGSSVECCQQRGHGGGIGKGGAPGAVVLRDQRRFSGRTAWEGGEIRV